jgi:hypothetical protein
MLKYWQQKKVHYNFSLGRIKPRIRLTGHIKLHGWMSAKGQTTLSQEGAIILDAQILIYQVSTVQLN